MVAGEHHHNLLQAISRANVRNGTDGGCGDCVAYVIGKGGKDMKALLADTFQPLHALADRRWEIPSTRAAAV
jgi:hypothetical protein